MAPVAPAAVVEGRAVVADVVDGVADELDAFAPLVAGGASEPLGFAVVAVAAVVVFVDEHAGIAATPAAAIARTRALRFM